MHSPMNASISGKVTNITEMPMLQRVNVYSKDKGAVAKKVCNDACIGCGLCARNCSYGAIELKNNLAVVNAKICTEKCTEATCTSKCPTEEEIKAKLRLVGYDKISISEKDIRVKLEKQGMFIDLGGIAKGFAVDEILKIYNKYDIENELINLGASSIYELGKNKGNNKNPSANSF